MSLRRSHVALTFGKELRETLRDRRTVFVMVLFPLFVYPLLSLLVTQVLTTRTRQREQRQSRVAIEAPAGSPTAIDLAARLARPPHELTVVPGGTHDVEAGRVDALVRAADAHKAGKLELVFDGTSDDSRQAADRLEERLTCALPAAVTPLYAFERRDLAPKAKVGGYLLSKVLPLMLVLMVLLGAFYPAIDVTAGERERGTLETILSAPVRRRDLLLGKLLAVVVLATLTGALNLVSMSITVRQLMHIADPSAAVPVPWLRAGATGLILVPCAFLFASVFITVGALARGFKEAQNLLMPAYLLMFTPAIIGALSEMPLRGVAAVVPGLNVTLLARDIALGKATALGTAAVLASTVVCGFIALSFAARLYASEGFLDAQARGRRAREAPSEGPGATAGEALALFAIAYLLLYFVFIPMQQRHFAQGVLASQWLGMAGLVAAFARFRGRRFVDVVRLRPPSAAAVAGGVLVGVSAFFVAGLLTEWIAPPPKEVIEHLRKTVMASEGTRSLGATLALVALTPAICEEILFRGAVLRGLETRLSPVAVVVLNGVLFGLFHIDLWRLLPTSLLGMALATLAVRSQSLWPSIAAHLCNNGLLVVLARLQIDDAWVERLPRGLQIGLLTAAAALTGFGLHLARRAKTPSVG